MKRVLKHLILACLLLPVISIAASLNMSNNFLIITDIHLDAASTHIMDINPKDPNREDDLDLGSFEKLIADIINNINNGSVPRPKFILLLGDIVGHMRINSESAVVSETAVFNLLKKSFTGIPILYTFGNNDSLKVNYGPFTDQDRTSSPKSPYDVAMKNAGWQNGFLSTGTICDNKEHDFPCIINEDHTNGYYSAYLQPGLRLISLNTVLFAPRRSNVHEQDAMQELQWLNTQLKLAEQNKESVLLAMHISPGNNVFDHSSFWLSKEQGVFLDIVKRYPKTIIGMLAAHTHAEELKIIKDDLHKNISAVYFTAALSTSHGNAPSAKTFYFSKNTGQWLLSNYDTFHFTMHDASMLFSKLYDYANYYCENLNNDNLSNCLGNVTADKMQKYFSAGNPNYSGLIKYPDDMVLYATPN